MSPKFARNVLKMSLYMYIYNDEVENYNITSFSRTSSLCSRYVPNIAPEITTVVNTVHVITTDTVDSFLSPNCTI